MKNFGEQLFLPHAETNYMLLLKTNINIVANIPVLVSSMLKKQNPTLQALHAFTLRQRRGMGSQYVSVYGCPAELHRAVRPLFML